MRILENLEPKIVFDYFEDLCNIPHGSTDTKQISDYCVEFAQNHKLEYYQDELNNVIIIKKATKGYESSPAMIIQGHLDMVCEKTSANKIDFTKDGLSLGIDGDYIYAKDTTLGGDDGIAVAMALAILASEDMEHPRIEAIFTVDEEIGMLGAAGIDVSMLKGNKLLNIDSEDEGVFTVSCAGGVTAECIVSVSRKKEEGLAYKLLISGLLGGHSGMEINKERGNANILMGRLLYNLSRTMNFSIKSLAGGQKDNAITKETISELLISEVDAAKLETAVKEYDSVLKHEYKSSDPGVTVTFEKLGMRSAETLDEESTKNVIFMLMNFPQGVQAMSVDIAGLVETSLNLGILKLNEGNISASFAVRSSVETERDALADKLTSLTEFLGGQVKFSGRYPGWEYKNESELRNTLTKVYQKQYGESPKIAAIHAGLECGIFSGKMNDLDCVSIGPDMKDVHTVNERLSISSVQRVWNFVVEVLKESK